jgi:hypothetical protein
MQGRFAGIDVDHFEFEGESDNEQRDPNSNPYKENKK